MLFAGVLLTSACASQPRSAEQNEEDGFVSRSVGRTSEGFEDAALAPLSDVNLRRTPIPGKLAAITSPYDPLPEAGCETIAAEVSALTEILGPDADAPKEEEESLRARAGEEAADATLGQITGVVTGFIPYRSIVRYASGATAHERRLRAAYDRGAQRRAYLKGIGASLGCAPPAAPIPPPPEGAPEVEFRGSRPAPAEADPPPP